MLRIMTQSAQYPYALAHGTLISACDAAKGVRYNCPGCLEWVVPRVRNGNWHFAHDRTTERCDASFALHETAKIFAASGIRFALSGKTPAYSISRPCQDCGKEVAAILVGKTECVDVHPGQSVFSEMYSDLVLRENGRVIAVLEIIVTRPLGTREAQEYKNSDIPVFVANINNIEAARKIERGFEAQTMMNVPERQCAVCTNEIYGDRSDLANVEAVEEGDTQGKPSVRRHRPRRSRQSIAGLPFTPWIKDRFERIVLNPNTRADMYANAMVLSKLGFQQALSKPWLFSMKRKHGVVFASFGSTPDVPIWRNTAALLYHDFDCSDLQAQEVFSEVVRHCRLSGAAVRIEGEEMPDGIAEAKSIVNQSVLAQLVELSNKQYRIAIVSRSLLGCD